MSDKEKQKKDKIKAQKRFGELVKKYRKTKGWSLTIFGNRCDMESSNVAKLEGGKLNPTLFTIIKISRALEISVQELLTDFKPE